MLRRMRVREIAPFTVAMLLGVSLGAGLHAAVAAPSGTTSVNTEPTTSTKPTDPTKAKPRPAPVDYSRFRKLDIFARALTTIEQHYVRPVDGEQLIQSAIGGLVAQLDPHSEYLPPKEARLLREDIEGSFGGVGMVVIQKFESEPEPRLVLDVREVIPGGPAARAGVRAGDLILAIEGKPISHYVDLRRAIMVMRGDPGTKVSFTVEPKGQTPRTVSVSREVIDSPAVVSTYLGDGIGHIRLRDFSETSARELEQALQSLRSSTVDRKLKGVVLDLRDNGGGLLDQAIAVVDLFVAKGPIVRTRGRMGSLLDESYARPGGPWNHVPLAVLVNKASASASEVVAGALQDHRRGLIVGERTYGKGSVQAPFDLGDGSVLKLTIALYYTPADRLIQATGITPDVLAGKEGPLFVDSHPDLEPERAHPRHLQPEQFGYSPVAEKGDLSKAVAAAGDDFQLQVAVEHLETIALMGGKASGKFRRRRD
ncbi:MAG TPA: S41 family peptidase [Nannocystis exedens]|nr:S41 family peptidase [Nannocystis exedens]